MEGTPSPRGGYRVAGTRPKDRRPVVENRSSQFRMDGGIRRDVTATAHGGIVVPAALVQARDPESQPQAQGPSLQGAVSSPPDHRPDREDQPLQGAVGAGASARRFASIPQAAWRAKPPE